MLSAASFHSAPLRASPLPPWDALAVLESPRRPQADGQEVVESSFCCALWFQQRHKLYPGCRFTVWLELRRLPQILALMLCAP